MLTTCIRSMSGIYQLLASLVGVFSLFLPTAQADTPEAPDMQQWLAQPGADNTQSVNAIYYATPEFSRNFNNPAFALEIPDIRVNGAGFAESRERVYKSNEEKLLRRLSDRLKINLFSGPGLNSKHYLFLNTLKRELVGKSRIGKARYELRVSEQQAELHFSYNF